MWILIGCKNRADPTQRGVDEGLRRCSSAVLQSGVSGRSEAAELFFYPEIFLLLIFNPRSETEEERVRIADRGQKTCLKAEVHVTQHHGTVSTLSRHFNRNTHNLCTTVI